MTTPWYLDGAMHFAVGIEDTFVPQEKPGERAIDEYVLTEHDVRWHADLALAADVGAHLVRWGVPWYQIQPERSTWDWDWLDRVVDRFGELGLRPVIDLMHYGTPLWLEGQFDHPDYPLHVAEYSVAVADRYADRVTDYTPVNEPMIHALFCGEYGYWPPYLTGERGLVRMISQLSQGFVAAQQGMAEVLGDRGVFVHVDAGMRYVGATDAPEHRDYVDRLRHQVWLVEDLVTGGVDQSHPLADFLLRSGMSEERLEFFRANAVEPSVVGVNYYPRHSTEVFEAGVHHRGGFEDPRPTQDDGVEGLGELLVQAAQRYGKPVMISETCVTGTVAERIAWMDESLTLVSKLREDGMDLVAYTWWPLFDMYEWTYRHSTNPRSDHLLSMGLWALEETSDGLARVRTPVADRFHTHSRDSRHRSAK